VLYKQKLEDPTCAKQHARILLDFSGGVLQRGAVCCSVMQYDAV